MHEGNQPCAYCERPGAALICHHCRSTHLYPDYRFLRSPDGKHILNARTYITEHDKLEPGRVYTVEELRRDFGMPRLSKLGPEPTALEFVVERL